MRILTFYKFLQLGLAALAYERLFEQNLVYKPVHVRAIATLEICFTQTLGNLEMRGEQLTSV